MAGQQTNPGWARILHWGRKEGGRDVCHFITATLSADGDISAVASLAKSRLLKWKLIEKSPMSQYLLAGEMYFFTTRGMCDCGTAIGSVTGDDELDVEPDFTREIKKFRKKGWTQTKIDRWLQQQNDDRQRKKAEAQQQRLAPSPEIKNWLEFISTVLRQGHATHIGLILHWYSGYVKTESIPIAERKWIRLNDLTSDYLLSAAEDVIHTFSR